MRHTTALGQAPVKRILDRSGTKILGISKLLGRLGGLALHSARFRGPRRRGRGTLRRHNRRRPDTRRGERLVSVAHEVGPQQESSPVEVDDDGMHPFETTDQVRPRGLNTSPVEPSIQLDLQPQRLPLPSHSAARDEIERALSHGPRASGSSPRSTTPPCGLIPSPRS